MIYIHESLKFGIQLQCPLGGNPEGQRSPGSLAIVQEGKPGCTGAGCSHVLEEELAGNKTSLAELRALAGTQGEKESL